MLGGLTALLGFAGAAHAAETISLIWQSTGTNAIINPRPSDLLVLDVIVNADATDGS
jgi:hypothetical protein